MLYERLRLAGSVAWLAWLAIHISFLIDFRNRIAVLFNWAYVYFTRRRHAQLIVGAAPLTEGAEAPARARPAAAEPAPAPLSTRAGNGSPARSAR